MEGAGGAVSEVEELTELLTGLEVEQEKTFDEEETKEEKELGKKANILANGAKMCNKMLSNASKQENKFEELMGEFNLLPTDLYSDEEVIVWKGF